MDKYILQLVFVSAFFFFLGMSTIITIDRAVTERRRFSLFKFIITLILYLFLAAIITSAVYGVSLVFMG